MFRDVSRCFENFLGSLWDVLIWYQAWKSDDVPHLVSTERGRKLCDIVSYYVRYVSRQAPKPIGSCRFWLWHFAKFRPRLSGKMVWLFCFFLILTTRPMVFDNIWWHSIVTIVLPSLLRLHSCRHVDHLLKDVESLHVQDLRWRDASWCFNILGEELGLVLCVMICHDMSWYVCRLQLYDILWYLNVFDGIWWYLLSFVF